MAIAKNTICIWYDKEAEEAARSQAMLRRRRMQFVELIGRLLLGHQAPVTLNSPTACGH